MKHLFTFFFTVVFSFFIVQTASSQKLLKDIKNRAQQKVEERVEQRANEQVDKEIDKQLDKVEDAIFNDEKENTESQTDGNKNSSNSRSEERLTNMMKKMGMGEPVAFESSYSFDNLVQMHIESYDEKGKKVSDGEFITHLSNDSKSMAYEFVSGDMAQPGMGFIIIDAKNGATIILSEENGQKTGIVYGLGTFFQTVAAGNVDDIDLSETPETYLANPNVEKTGRSKTIAGLSCEEYKYTDENTISNIWITKDLKMNTQDFFGTLFKTAIYSHGMGWGYMMEATTVNKENGEKSVLEVTKVDKNSNRKVVMGDYQVTNIGSFAPPAEK
ncbi:MAG TPA: DUF4412 domain-containing protein [Draconibacterium sp.]|nr:DUF4412 domain-containing protein [Draconibacterium sp.]HRX10262.1 DUF4412 domain-containing protein [Draconibacterium sp.]